MEALVADRRLHVLRAAPFPLGRADHELAAAAVVEAGGALDGERERRPLEVADELVVVAEEPHDARRLLRPRESRDERRVARAQRLEDAEQAVGLGGRALDVGEQDVVRRVHVPPVVQQLDRGARGGAAGVLGNLGVGARAGLRLRVRRGGGEAAERADRGEEAVAQLAVGGAVVRGEGGGGHAEDRDEPRGLRGGLAGVARVEAERVGARGGVIERNLPERGEALAVDREGGRLAAEPDAREARDPVRELGGLRLRGEAERGVGEGLVELLARGVLVGQRRKREPRAGERELVAGAVGPGAGRLRGAPELDRGRALVLPGGAVAPRPGVGPDGDGLGGHLPRAAHRGHREVQRGEGRLPGELRQRRRRRGERGGREKKRGGGRKDEARVHGPEYSNAPRKAASRTCARAGGGVSSAPFQPPPTPSRP